MRKRLIRGTERWTAHTRDLQPLAPGSRVMIQNQHGAGKIAKKWDRSGIILEDLGYNKYRVKVDGSGRITDRNRQFLRKFTPVTPGMPGPTPSGGNQPVDPSPESQNRQQFDPTPASPPRMPRDTIDPGSSTPSLSPGVGPSSHIPPPSPDQNPPESPQFVTPPSSPVETPDTGPVGVQPNSSPETPALPRRSTRVSRPPERLRYDKF